MWHFSKPAAEQTERFLNQQRTLAPTHTLGTVAGFNVDEASVLLGRGEAVYLAACRAIQEWRMFPPGWTEIIPRGPAIAVGQNVGVLASVFGLWWLNACRIDSVTHGPRCFGFTYVTLPGHVEMGEELFLVEWTSDDQVWFRIRAVSRPRYWMVKMAYPLARWLIPWQDGCSTVFGKTPSVRWSMRSRISGPNGSANPEDYSYAVKDFRTANYKEPQTSCHSAGWEGEAPAEPQASADAELRMRFGGSLTLP